MTREYRAEFTRSASKEFDRLSERHQQQVIDAVELLCRNPATELLDIKKLKGADSVFRFRLGSHRVVYELQKRRLVILIIKIGHRREVYRHR